MSPHKKRRHSSSNSNESTKIKHKKRKHKKRKVVSSSTDSSDDEYRKARKKAKKLKKLQKKELLKPAKKIVETTAKTTDIPIELMEKAKAMAPMTKEEWEKRQSVVRKVYDEATGRHRLVKGDGEVIEEIVSRERHKLINQQATKGDGDYFQSKLSSYMRK